MRVLEVILGCKRGSGTSVIALLSTMAVITAVPSEEALSRAFSARIDATCCSKNRWDHCGLSVSQRWTMRGHREIIFCTTLQTLGISAD
jgi:hypothetical protein